MCIKSHAGKFNNQFKGPKPVRVRFLLKKLLNSREGRENKRGENEGEATGEGSEKKPETPGIAHEGEPKQNQVSRFSLSLSKASDLWNVFGSSEDQVDDGVSDGGMV